MSFLWAAAIAITVIAGGALLRYGKPGNARDNAADASALWQWFIFLAAVGFGFWAALVYLRAAAGGDPGFGGLVHIAVAAGVLTLAVLATSGLLLLLGRFVQGKGRIAIAGMVSLVLGTGFLYPLAVEGSLHRRAADARRVAQFEAELAAMQARMKPHGRIRHAAVDVEHILFSDACACLGCPEQPERAAWDAGGSQGFHGEPPWKGACAPVAREMSDTSAGV